MRSKLSRLVKARSCLNFSREGPMKVARDISLHVSTPLICDTQVISKAHRRQEGTSRRDLPLERRQSFEDFNRFTVKLVRSSRFFPCQSLDLLELSVIKQKAHNTSNYYF